MEVKVNEFSSSDVTWCERLYIKKAAEILLYGRALGLSHSEAEDVLQETFAALMRLPEMPEQPEHYVLRSFRNQTLNYRRSLWRRLRREWESTRWFERSTDETEKERAAMACLAQLPLEQREVIVLKIWHQHTFEAIGQLLGISPNTVAGRYRYGLSKLKTCLNGDTYERTEQFRESVEFLEAARPVTGA